MKEDVASKVEERDQWKTKFKSVYIVIRFLSMICVSNSQLNSQWEGKVKIIDSLELNLQQVQKSFSEKESQLLLEKDQALQKAK